LAAFEDEGGNEFVFAAQLYVDNLALQPLYAARLRILAQVLSIQCGIEVEGIRQAGRDKARIARRPGEAAKPRRHRIEAVVGERRRVAETVQLQPVMMEGHHIDRLAERAEGMEIAMAGAAPVPELDAKLDRRLGAAH